jgi:hypothetical protein
MTRGHLTNAEDRACVICGSTFTPLRRKQETCSPATGRNCGMTLANLKRAGTRDASGMFARLKPGEKQCEKCGRSFTASRTDAKTCGASCPGRPDEIKTCANPRCGQPFTLKGNSHGGRTQRYCSKQCRDLNAPYRLRERFRRYGVTPEQYQEMIKVQDNLCAICGQPPSPSPRTSWREGDWDLAVDHDHTTGKRRDLLCHRHNLGLGLFDDDPVILRAAADYIERHRT